MGRYQTEPDVISRKIDDHITILLGLDSGQFYRLNEVSHLIWEGLQNGQDPDKIATTVCAVHNATKQQVRSDIDDLVAELLKSGLVKRI